MSAKKTFNSDPFETEKSIVEFNEDCLTIFSHEKGRGCIISSHIMSMLLEWFSDDKSHIVHFLEKYSDDIFRLCDFGDGMFMERYPMKFEPVNCMKREGKCYHYSCGDGVDRESYVIDGKHQYIMNVYGFADIYITTIDKLVMNYLTGN